MAYPANNEEEIQDVCFCIVPMKYIFLIKRVLLQYNINLPHLVEYTLMLVL